MGIFPGKSPPLGVAATLCGQLAQLRQVFFNGGFRGDFRQLLANQLVEAFAHAGGHSTRLFQQPLIQRKGNIHDHILCVHILCVNRKLDIPGEGKWRDVPPLSLSPLPAPAVPFHGCGSCVPWEIGNISGMPLPHGSSSSTPKTTISYSTQSVLG
ncbi:MAG: hypothetical protein H6Q05_3197 [Acidobacteria bacterium]|nr:hypothetical protein [Acidobacteriota bacterium]